MRGAFETGIGTVGTVAVGGVDPGVAASKAGLLPSVVTVTTRRLTPPGDDEIRSIKLARADGAGAE
jgi:hypothetical protein